MPIPRSMNIHPQILVFVGSLVAIIALAGLAALLKLGGKPVLVSESEAARVAGEVWDGFAPVAVALDREGSAALIRDGEGRIMLVKRHGNKFAGRILDARAGAQAAGGVIEVSPGEVRYGDVRLAIDEAASWAAAINRLHRDHDA